MRKGSIHAEEVLYFFLYTIEPFVFPTYRNWCESYEGWLYRNGLLRRVQWLEAQKFIKSTRRADQLVYQITESGRQFALGGRDPERMWARKWDGQWRMFVFDLPANRKAVRHRLLRWLKARGFGWLQNSVWIHTDPMAEVADAVKDFREDVESFIVFESRCALGYANDAVVRGAWHMDEVEKRYRVYLDKIERWLAVLRQGRVSPHETFRIIREERSAWAHAAALDPFLPRSLWSRGYLGAQAWEKRKALLRLLPSVAKEKRENAS
jgi:phenylacetic acid degradation operon negative regulatory protein